MLFDGGCDEGGMVLFGAIPGCPIPGIIAGCMTEKHVKYQNEEDIKEIDSCWITKLLIRLVMSQHQVLNKTTFFQVLLKMYSKADLPEGCCGRFAVGLKKFMFGGA